MDRLKTICPRSINAGPYKKVEFSGYNLCFGQIEKQKDRQTVKQQEPSLTDYASGTGLFLGK